MCGARHEVSQGQREVEPARFQRLRQRGIARDMYFHAQPGVRTLESAQYLGQHVFAEVFLQPKSHPSFQLGAAYRGDGLVVEVQQPPRVAEHHLASLSQRHAAPRLAQQGRAGLVLQLLQLRTDCRGRPTQAFGSPGEAAQFHAGGEAA
jgi:hypothetical protein